MQYPFVRGPITILRYTRTIGTSIMHVWYLIYQWLNGTDNDNN